MGVGNHLCGVTFIIAATISHVLSCLDPFLRQHIQYVHLFCFLGNNDDVSYKCLHQGKWSSGATMATPSQVWNYSLSLPRTPALSLICLKQDVSTASPSCLGGGWSSVEDLLLVDTSTLASLGLQAKAAGLPSTQ